jgi:flagellar biosynthesis protein FlhG
MNDQATQLRQLMQRRVAPTATTVGRPPHALIVAGGQPGLGVTTVAVHLAASLSRHGRRVVLVDADLQRPGIPTPPVSDASRPPRGLVDVLTGRREIHEVLQPVAAGLQVLPGDPQAVTTAASHRDVAQRRLLRQLHTLGSTADWVVLDVGSGSDHISQALWETADVVLLVTTPAATAIVTTYGMVKRMSTVSPRATLDLVVNRAGNPRVAHDVHRRIDSTCQRFLRRNVNLLGILPSADQAGSCCGAAPWSTWGTADTALARALSTVALQLIEMRDRRPNKLTLFAEATPPFSPIHAQSASAHNFVKLE